MKALRFHGNKDVRLDEIPIPDIRPGWVKIKNGWAGVCGAYVFRIEITSSHLVPAK